MKNKRLSEDEKQKIKELYQQGYGCVNIARMIKRSPTSVHCVLDPIIKDGIIENNKNVDKGMIIALGRTGLWSVSQIADECHCREDLVLETIREAVGE